MEQKAYTPEILDLRQQNRVWERVGPQLPPYGEMGEDNKRFHTELMPRPAQQVFDRNEAVLPGAEVNPCCMGSAAEEAVAVIAGFGEDELSECRHLQALSRQAPGWAVGQLRDLAGQHANQAKRLFAIYYLITGNCYTPVQQTERIYVGRWCPALRERYHAAACNGMNYERASEETTDICLKALLRELSEASYQQANVLLRILEQSMRCS